MKDAGWHSPRLGLTISTASTQPKTFNAYESYPTVGDLIAPIYVDVNNEPETLRGFVFFEDNGEKLSHTIAVGTPKGIHYIYDLETGNLVSAWRGDFIDATPMWHRRGNGSFRPNGLPVWTFLNQPFAELSSLEAPFPDIKNVEDFTPKGYQIDKESKLPIFQYNYKDNKVTQAIRPASDNASLLAEITFSKSDLSNHYFKLAEGTITSLPDGSYKVNEDYYLEITSNQPPMLRNINNIQELVVPITGSSLTYKMIW